MKPKIVLNIIAYCFGTFVFYGVTLFVLAFLSGNFNDTFRNIYVSALPLAFVLELPLIGHKIKGKYNEKGIFTSLGFAVPIFENAILMIAITYALTLVTLFILSLAAVADFQNILLSALPLTVVSAMFLLSYKFWEFIKETA